MPIQPEVKTYIVNEDETLANFPQTTRKTPIFQPSVVPPGHLFYGTSRFDQDDQSQEIGEGGAIIFNTSTPDDVVVIEGRFHDYVYILGGRICAWASSVNDEVSLDTVFPASAPASTPGVGNASLHPELGFFYPAENGDFTVDGSTLEVGTINQNLCPVPAAEDNTGFWNWDPTQNPSITPAPNQDGAYHLFAVEIVAVRQANKYPVKDGEVTPAAGIQGKKVLPHWLWRFTLKKGPEATPTQCRILLYTARVKTR